MTSNHRMEGLLELLEERTWTGVEGAYLCRYLLIPHRFSQSRREDCYDIQVEQFVGEDRDDAGEQTWRLIDRQKIRGLTEDPLEAEDFFHMAAAGMVMPVSLFEVYDDWMSAFHPRKTGGSDS